MLNRLVAPLLVATLATACGTMLGRSDSMAARSVARGMAGESAEASKRMVIETGSTSVEVEDLKLAVARTEALVSAAGGVLSSSQMHEKSARIQARVPAAELHAFLNSVGELGEEQNRSTTATDVTDAYSDLEAEIGNLRALRDRLRNLLDRAKNVEEVLEVERELVRVQTTLDSLEARRQRMAKDVRLSAVSIHFFAKPPPRILGPLGLVVEGTSWIVRKLYVLSP